VALQVAAGRSYVSLNPLPNGQYTIATAAPIADAVSARAMRRYVLIDYEVPQGALGAGGGGATHLLAVRRSVGGA
jgi:hypothetical protein